MTAHPVVRVYEMETIRARERSSLATSRCEMDSASSMSRGERRPVSGRTFDFLALPG